MESTKAKQLNLEIRDRIWISARNKFIAKYGCDVWFKNRLKFSKVAHSINKIVDYDLLLK